jgi:glycosyltransferase involved in cell wall biosynthesis
MRICCLIDHLGPGGAQRQLTTLAVLLKNLGHTALFVTYHPNDFFRPQLEAAGIDVECLHTLSRIRTALAVRKTLRASKQDVVLAFLEGPSLYAELAGLPSRHWGLVVSERSHLARSGAGFGGKRIFHHLADYVTTNSHATRRALAQAVPTLASRLVTIYNCLDLSVFKPPSAPVEHPGHAFRFVVAASYRELKNTAGLAQALALVRRQDPNLRVEIDWYGDPAFLVRDALDTRYLESVQRLIHQLSLAASFRLHPATRDIVHEYQSADAVVLPSFIEGLPNAICEGMACGRPVLASRVGDVEMLVRPGRNGFLFDPARPESIAQAILDFCRLPRERRIEMGHESRRLAEDLFAPGPVAAAYARLLEAAAQQCTVPATHWPAPALAPEP